MIVLITGKGASVDIVYKHGKNGKWFVLDTGEVKETLKDVAIDHPEVIYFLKTTIEEGLHYIERENT